LTGNIKPEIEVTKGIDRPLDYTQLVWLQVNRVMEGVGGGMFIFHVRNLMDLLIPKHDKKYVAEIKIVYEKRKGATYTNADRPQLDKIEGRKFFQICMSLIGRSMKERTHLERY